jgi:hypothetical protein
VKNLTPQESRGIDNPTEQQIAFLVEIAMKKSLIILLMAYGLMSCTAYNAQYPLHAAASKGNTPQVQAMIKSGSPLEGRDAAGWTPLMHAAWSGNIETVQALLAQGANVNASDPQGNTAIYNAIGYSYSGDIAKLLKDNGAKLNIRNKAGETLLHYLAQACPSSDTPGTNIIGYLLLDSNIDPSAVNNAGATAYSLAMENYCMDMVGELRRRGVMETFKGAGAFNEALRKPSFYTPPAGEYVVTADRKPLYELAVADCNHMLTGYKTVFLFALGPIGWGASVAMDQVRISRNFDKCMKVMGFNCTNNCAK